VTATRLRPLAESDLIQRTRYYRGDAGADAASRFFDAAIAALSAIGRMPNAGSTNPGEVAGIDGLRARRIAGFPCAWSYFANDRYVDVVRLLHEAQDLPVVLADLAPE
jgi:toxin ParE1/3/4